MLKVYVPETEKQIDFLKSKGIKEKKFDYHPHIMEKEIEKFLNYSKYEKIEVFTYNTVALDYIPEDIIYWVDRKNNIIKFEEKFSNTKKYFYAGEILLNMRNDE